MTNTQEIKALMVRHEVSRQDLADALGVSYSTLLSRLKDGNFSLKQVEVLISKLHIDNPSEVFFSGSEVAQDATKEQKNG